MKLTLENVIAFYDKKGINSACPICGKADWTLLEPPEEYNWAIASTRIDGGMMIPTPSIPIITLMCGHCYGLRSHAALPIESTNKAKDDEGI